MQKILSLAVAVGVMTVWPGISAHALSFTFQELMVPGAMNPIPRKINDHDDVVGYADFGGRTQGFLFNVQHGMSVIIAYPGACETYPAGVNNKLQIVGTYSTGSCDAHGGATQHAFFMDADGSFHTIDLEMETGAYPSPGGINDHGDIAGTVLVGGVQRGFVLRCAAKKRADVFACSTPVIFEAPGVGTFLTRAMDINKKGASAGEFLDHPESNRQHGFRRDTQGHFTIFDYPGALGTSVSGLNKTAVVGFWYAEEFARHSMVVTGGEYVTMDPPGVSSSVAIDINENRVIIGYYVAQGIHAYIATPVQREQLDLALSP